MNLFRRCTSCKEEKPAVEFARTRCRYFSDGYLPLCNRCLDTIIKTAPVDNRWNEVNKMCQWADVPFIPSEWEKIYKGYSENWFGKYISIFNAKEFETISWRDYNDIYIKLHQNNELVNEIPGYEDVKYEKLLKKWGPYERSELDQLENLFNETLNTQNVTTGNQIDQLKKICKTSLLIDQKIEAGAPYKDLMDSYEKLIKAADLTPKNTKNSNDFDSMGEIFDYLEQKGWMNKFYDGARRDEVDETIKNIQNWTRKLCIGESTLTEEILQKLNNLNDNPENDLTDYESYDYDEYEKNASDIIRETNIEVDV